MIIYLAEDVRNARLQALADKFDASATLPGYIELYTAPMPAPGAAITTQDLLGTCVLSDPAGTVDAGQLTFDPISEDIAADASGDIAWARGYNGDGGWVLDMDAGDSNSNAVLKFNTVSAIAGGIIKILSGVLTEGNT